jgi:predicted phage terminase large subunit-like protein
MKTEIRPQPKQLRFLASSADICIYGGSAGGGKTWSLLVDPLRFRDRPGFGAVEFRRTIPEITRTGGLWDESAKLYSLFGGEPNLSSHSWTFKSGARISFAGLQYEKDLESWRGAQIAAIYFDQLETFERQQFFYMASRNRTTCGIRPYIRATCNPEPGWLADFLAWWIAPDGYADMSKAGATRWFILENDAPVWADSAEELKDAHPGVLPKSVQFIPATIFDNQILLKTNPGYLANLQGLGRVDRERLLGDAERGGNWNIKPEAGNVFNRAWFEIVPDIDFSRRWSAVIRWDFAATEQSVTSADPDYTAWCVMLYDAGSREALVVEAGQKRLKPSVVYDEFQERCRYWYDYFYSVGILLKVRWEIEPGSASKREARTFASLVPWADAHGVPSVGAKLTRARPLAAQAEHGFVKVLRGEWNEEWLNHMHSQPAAHDDMMDAASGAFDDLTRTVGFKQTARSYGG